MTRAVTGLILTGGGARAAYQVGVLRALTRIRREAGAADGRIPSPSFAVRRPARSTQRLAGGADDDRAVDGIARVCGRFHAEQVYRADPFGVIRTGARWLTMLTIGWALARWRRARPRSLLDNSPLQELLQQLVPIGRLHGMLEAGHLRALAISASSYSSGQPVTFYQSLTNIAPWMRSQRVAIRAAITHEHLLASSAIPFVFPAIALPFEGQSEWFGDGRAAMA
jgi:NTE family protein